MTTTRTFIIYSNDNGTDLHEFQPEVSEPEEVYEYLLSDHDDEYFETSAFVLTIEGILVEGAKLTISEVFIPEEEDL